LLQVATCCWGNICFIVDGGLGMWHRDIEWYRGIWRTEISTYPFPRVESPGEVEHWRTPSNSNRSASISGLQKLAICTSWTR
jgi:hypothetical protein